MVIAQHEDGALYAVVIADTISVDFPPSNTVFDYLVNLQAALLRPGPGLSDRLPTPCIGASRKQGRGSEERRNPVLKSCKLPVLVTT